MFRHNRFPKEATKYGNNLLQRYRSPLKQPGDSQGCSMAQCTGKRCQEAYNADKIYRFAGSIHFYVCRVFDNVANQRKAK